MHFAELFEMNEWIRNWEKLTFHILCVPEKCKEFPHVNLLNTKEISEIEIIINSIIIINNCRRK